ncbi:MAG: hypothetical protein IPK97_19870 [Ahniella sp.]|nr:hypothetical protein [Ahniella sp.]
MNLSRLLLCGLALALSACSSTVFVNLPDGVVSKCDERFVGTWQVKSDGDTPPDQDEPDFLTIEPGCAKFIGTDVAAHEHEDVLDDTEIQFIDGKRHDYVVTRDRPSPDDAESGDTVKDQAYTLHRIRMSRDQRIELLDVNHERISDLLRAGKLHGKSEITAPKKGNRTYENLIESDSAELTRALNDRKVFLREATIVLQRVDAEVLREALSRPKVKTDDQGQSGE